MTSKKNSPDPNDENMEKIEEQDEPDFMDNLGQMWEFACRGNKFEAWCIKQGGMLAIENNKKWRRYRCGALDGDGTCQFEAIYLNSCGNLYSRGKHNHGQGIENEKESASERKTQRRVEVVEPKTHFLTRKPQINFGDDYVDRMGKCWKFCGKIGDADPSRQKLRNEFGFAHITPKQTTLNMYCWKEGPSGRKCQFAGVYLRTNGCVYTRGEHECYKNQTRPNLNSRAANNHVAKKESNEKDAQNAEFKPTAGKERFRANYYFYCQIKNEQDLQNVLVENGLVQDNVNNKGMRKYYGCKMNTKTWTKRPPLCKFRAIYDRKNKHFYLNKIAHNHLFEEDKKEVFIQKEMAPKHREDYNEFGKTFKFYAQIGRNATKAILRKKFDFYTINETAQKFHMYCHKSGPGVKKCKFAGIYLSETGRVYTRGTHECGKEMPKQKSPRKISNAKVPLPKKWNASKNANYNNVNNFERETHPVAAIIHEYYEQKPYQATIDGNPDYVDSFGNFWPFVAQIGKNITKEQFSQQYGISGTYRTKYGFYLRCAKVGKGTNGRCRFRAIYVESTGCLYAKPTWHDHAGAFDFKMLKNK